MRIDLLLKSLCLAKTRSQARKGCDAGRVTLNGARAKPSAEARAGDVVEIRYPRAVIAVELLELPSGQASRRDAARFYRVLREHEVEEGVDWND